MASKSRKTKIIRKHKVAASGTRRKAKLRGEGTTKTKKELFGDD